MAVKNPEELAAKRQSAAYLAKIAMLRRGDPDMSDEDMDKLALQANDEAVYGFDAKKDRKGNYIPQGIGSPGHETANHFNSIRRYEGKEAYEAALREIWKRDPDHAQKLGLPKPPAEKAA